MTTPDSGDTDAVIPSAVSLSLETPSSASLMASFTSTRASTGKSRKSKTPQKRLSATTTNQNHGQKKAGDSQAPEDFLSSSAQSILMPSKRDKHSNARVHKRLDLNTPATTTKKPPRKSRNPTHRTPLKHKSVNKSNIGNMQDNLNKKEHSEGHRASTTSNDHIRHAPPNPSLASSEISQSNNGTSSTTHQLTHTSDSPPDEEKDSSEYSVDIIRKLRASVQKLLDEETTKGTEEDTATERSDAEGHDSVFLNRIDAGSRAQPNMTVENEGMPSTQPKEEAEERPQGVVETDLCDKIRLDDFAKINSVSNDLGAEEYRPSVAYVSTTHSDTISSVNLVGQSDADRTSYDKQTSIPPAADIGRSDLRPEVFSSGDESNDTLLVSVQRCSNHSHQENSDHATSLLSEHQLAVHQEDSGDEDPKTRSGFYHREHVNFSDRHLRLLRVQQSNWSSDYSEDIIKHTSFRPHSRSLDGENRSEAESDFSSDVPVTVPSNVKYYTQSFVREYSDDCVASRAEQQNHSCHSQCESSSSKWSPKRPALDTNTDGASWLADIQASHSKTEECTLNIEGKHQANVSDDIKASMCSDETLSSSVKGLTLESRSIDNCVDRSNSSFSTSLQVDSRTLEVVQPLNQSILDSVTAHCESGEHTIVSSSVLNLSSQPLKASPCIDDQQETRRNEDSPTDNSRDTPPPYHNRRDLTFQSSLLQHHFEENSPASGSIGRTGTRRVQRNRTPERSSAVATNTQRRVNESDSSQAVSGTQGYDVTSTMARLHKTSRVVSADVQGRAAEKKSFPLEYAEDPIRCIDGSKQLQELSSVSSSEQGSVVERLATDGVSAEQLEESENLESHKRHPESHGEGVLPDSSSDNASCSNGDANGTFQHDRRRYSDTTLKTAAKALVEYEDEQSFRHTMSSENEGDDTAVDSNVQQGRSAAFMAAMSIDVPKRRYGWNKRYIREQEQTVPQYPPAGGSGSADEEPWIQDKKPAPPTYSKSRYLPVNRYTTDRFSAGDLGSRDEEAWTRDKNLAPPNISNGRFLPVNRYTSNQSSAGSGASNSSGRNFFSSAIAQEYAVHYNSSKISQSSVEKAPPTTQPVQAYRENSEDMEVCSMLNDHRLVSNVGRDVLLNPCSSGYKHSTTVVGHQVSTNDYEEALREAQSIGGHSRRYKEASRKKARGSRPTRCKRVRRQRQKL